MTLERPIGFVTNLPNCGVTAIAIVTGQPYRKVWDWFATRNNHTTGHWKGRTFSSQYSQAMEAFGTKFKACPVGMTVEGFVNWHTVKDRTYLINVSGHVFVLRNGVIADNTNHHGKPFIAYARRKVKKAWEILSQ